MTVRPLLCRAAAIVAAAGVLVASGVVPVAGAQEVPPLPEEGRPVYAVVSPVANPVCQASGTATLLVPIVGGLVGQNLGTGDSVPIGDLILDGLGPVFIVCGSLPPAPGSRCQLDDQIAGLLPDDVTSLGPPPAPLGNAIDAVGAVLSAAGVDSADAGGLGPALQCRIGGPAGAPSAPPAPPSLPLMPSLSAALPSVPVAAGTSPLPALVGPAPAPAVAATPTPATPASAPQLALDLIRRVVPGWLEAAQLLLAGFLLLFLTSSWTTSLRLRRSA